MVLVDDLDRCLPETAIQTLEAIRLFVSLPSTAFVIGADEAMIEYAVKDHFKNLPEDEIRRGYPRAYLEKLIQVPFRIPSLGEAETRIYVTMLLVGTLVGEEHEGFKKLLKRAGELLSQPWERNALGDEDFTSAFRTLPDGVAQPRTLSSPSDVTAKPSAPASHQSSSVNFRNGAFSPRREPSRDLTALIQAHKAAYGWNT